MDCTTQSGLQCGTIQLLEPDATLPVGVAGGTGDPSLTERGDVALTVGQSVVAVTFATPKAGSNYRFEYLYVDVDGIVNPGAIEPVVQVQTAFGFTVDLAGAPPADGYVLRWRVVIVTITTPGVVDSPESLYLQLPFAVPDLPIIPPTQGLMDIFFVNPRSNTTYGFTELRVENLVDDPAIQTFIVVQVVEKRTDGFKIAINPLPFNNHYFLAVRTP